MSDPVTLTRADLDCLNDSLLCIQRDAEQLDWPATDLRELGMATEAKLLRRIAGRIECHLDRISTILIMAEGAHPVEIVAKSNPNKEA